MEKKIFEKIYQIVRKIPKGKVATYGMIARQVGTNSQVVGWALHANRGRVCPCHRVVDRNGRLAPGFTFGGPVQQKQKLLAEGVRFKDEKQVDLEKCLWLP